MKTTSLVLDIKTLVIAGCILLLTIIVSILFVKLSGAYIRKRVSSNHIDPTSYYFAQKFVTAIIYIVGIAFALVQIPAFKTIGHSLLAGAGILSLVAGLASQQALSNIMSGFLIVMFKPFKINDKITFNQNYTGVVEEINLRHVVLKDLENNRVIVPNSVISSQVIVNTNLTENKICKMIEIGIGYGSDIGKALKIMEDEVLKHPFHLDNRTPSDIENNVPAVVCRVISLDSSSVTLKAWAYAENSSNGFVMYCDLLRSIKERFDREGIEIPYSYQNVIIQNPSKEDS
ncbi:MULTISPECIES: mechanosensitive ion channel family protein [unclassified Leeuwenhoekiella]|uniref:mechanosensitive ion channel family protein n=1 Tax=unclassified Leeuwenhoekiella TaxID=2615029 RepID=UPI000C539B6D|nr:MULTISPECIES: mechanosensitive ion channel family protein [unclassified Leeuwenhoekiella]MAW94456.1 mechanosensitive ion channel protein MscS [Leeuwenhoekiella sp.]MAW96952.1 mechanosensitive ion channel protein MscS [Leeuwenhoekiella sp.]MBA81134.1 mechanosensitive ion channel protein MscS [Leeuwenhoekiella sp.]|tara:strand:- start:50784 stop:51647 length:864 start_codon:yes stop_codon:yes gene_type:complete